MMETSINLPCNECGEPFGFHTEDCIERRCPGCGVISQPGGIVHRADCKYFPEKDTSLGKWWMETAKDDLNAMLPKVFEYTASDLVLMGQFLAEWTGVAPESGSETAVMFYILGKVARAVAAYKEGRLPSDDTLHDICVYAMMARRIRAVGGWPG